MSAAMIIFYSLTELYQVICINELMKVNHDKREHPILPDYLVWLGVIVVLNLIHIFIGIPIVNFFTSFLGILGCCHLLYAGTWKNKVYISVFLCILGAAIEMVVFICIYFLNKNNLIGPMNSQDTWIFGSVASKLILFANIKIIAKRSKKEKAEVSGYSWIILVLVALCNVYVLFLVVEAGQIIDTAFFKVQSLVLYIVIIVINYLEFFVYDQMLKKTEVIWKNRLLEQQTECYERELREREAVEQEIRKIKHNLTNHYICMQEYVKGDNIEGLRSYLKELVEEFPTKYCMANSGNQVVDAILNYKINQAKELGIEFELQLEIPESMGVEHTSLSIILGNAVDNAIKGCLDAKVSNPKISILLRYVKGCVYLEVTNPFGSLVYDEKGNLITSKEDKKSHGFGLTSMKSEVDKYNGELKIESSKGKFKLFVLLFGKL